MGGVWLGQEGDAAQRGFSYMMDRQLQEGDIIGLVILCHLKPNTHETEYCWVMWLSSRLYMVHYNHTTFWTK